MAKYDSLRKNKRDAKIRAFLRDHPTWSQQEVADKFGICRSNVSRIWRNQETRAKKEDSNG